MILILNICFIYLWILFLTFLFNISVTLIFYFWRKIETNGNHYPSVPVLQTESFSYVEETCCHLLIILFIIWLRTKSFVRRKFLLVQQIGTVSSDFWTSRFLQVQNQLHYIFYNHYLSMQKLCLSNTCYRTFKRTSCSLQTCISRCSK